MLPLRGSIVPDHYCLLLQTESTQVWLEGLVLSSPSVHSADRTSYYPDCHCHHVGSVMELDEKVANHFPAMFDVLTQNRQFLEGSRLKARLKIGH